MLGVRLHIIPLVLAIGACAAPALAQERAPARPPLPAGLPLYLPGAVGLNLMRDVVALGRALFVDPRLSLDGTVSCATCHDPARAFTDGRTVATGVRGRRGTRHTPTLVNRGYGEAQFWDGRVRTLLEQVLHPIEQPAEMGSSRDRAVAAIADVPRYRTEFRQVFGDVVDTTSLAQALAAYVATIFSGDAPFDRYAAGDTLALSDRARLGRRLFDGRARCSTCHRGPNFTDEQFHNTGVAWRTAARTSGDAAVSVSRGDNTGRRHAPAPADSGRFLVTGQLRHLGAFKTPTLRETARTAPYMHDGSMATLEEVIEFYDRGGHANAQLAAELRPLRLTTEEKSALVAFLRTLSGAVREGAW